MKAPFASRGNPQLYEINTLAWLFELSQRLGRPVTLGDVPLSEWQKIRESGTDFIWLMGIWQRSQLGRHIFINEPECCRISDTVLPGWTEEDIIGSSYSIDAYEPDPLVGSWEDIDGTLARLNQLGMGLILDFIPNHTGLDYPWVMEHPDYYIQGAKEDYEKDPTAFFPLRSRGKTLYFAHGKDPNYSSWSDTLQLNYFNPEARQAIIRELQKVARHCDGVRCDMAMLLLNKIFSKTWEWANRSGAHELTGPEFWEEAIAQVPGLVWIAEGYWDTEWTLQQMGFDYVYDKRLYDRLRWSAAYDVYLHLTADVAFQKKLLRFIENHDEPRVVEAFGKRRSLAAAVVIATTPGMKLYHQGQLDGKRLRIPLQVRQVSGDRPDSEVRAFYDRLLKIANQDIFHTGSWKLKEVLPVGPDNSFRNLIAYLWQSANGIKIVVVNLSPDYAQGRVSLEYDLAADKSYTLYDELNEQKYLRNGKDMAHPGLHVMLDEYKAHIFDVSPVEC